MIRPFRPAGLSSPSGLSMTDLIKPAPVHDLGANKHLPSAGQWLWVRSRANYADASRGLAEGETHEWLGCIDHIGSNYVRITSPRDADRYTRSIRIHFDQLDDVTRPENDPDAVIAARIAHHKANAQSLIEEVAATISNLGLERSHALAHAAAGTDSNALIALSNAIDPKIYGHALQVAKDNGAKRALIPIENKRNFLDVSADIMEHVDPIFFGDAKTAALKALGMN